MDNNNKKKGLVREQKNAHLGQLGNMVENFGIGKTRLKLIKLFK
jgi:hypothetical protein